MEEFNPRKVWVNYTVALAFGVAFSITLLNITWNNSLEAERREFALLSSSIKDIVARNVQTTNDTLNSLASFLEANPELSEQQYRVISTAILGLHPFIEGAVFLTNTEIGGTIPSDNFGIRYLAERDTTIGLPATELTLDNHNVNVINNLIAEDAVITLTSGFVDNGWNAYWILKKVNLQMMENQGDQRVSGIVAILVNTSKFLRNNFTDTNITLLLQADSAGLSGRQFLFQQPVEMQSGFVVTQLLDEGNTRFPLYSIKLSVLKDVLWNEIDASMIFIAILIGGGVTLLMISVVRTREEQEHHLRERNIVIEAKVREQTVELAHARDEALQASLMKSSFLASMSHEIRTPLNAIIGMSDLLAETELDFEQKKYVGVFKKAGDTLLSLVNDILDLSKIEANQLQLETIEFNLVDTVEESVEIYALKAAEKGVEMICNVDTSIKPIRQGDPSRLRQILLNLISNALKFTEKGEIVISVVRQQNNSGNEDSGLIEISVSDTGTGIPADKLELIFASFTQADSSTTRKYGGTGLGLTISRRLVEMMEGRIWAESELGFGSRFIVQLDIPVTANHQTNMSSQQGILTGTKIMLVDDNETSSSVLKSYIHYLGAELIPVADGHSALNHFENELSHTKVDLVLADANLSDMDGFSLAIKIREKQANIPVILILNPVDLNQSQKKMALSHSSQIYLTRPVKKKELFHQLISVLSAGNRKKSLDTQAFDQKPVKPLRILLVDDNADNRLLVNAYLKKLPYELDEAQNGEEAVSRFKAGSYDIVFMDVQMPVMDGREAIRQIRQWERLNNTIPVPIIALTAHAVKEEIDMCIEAGCNTHLSKPVKKSTLISTIQSYTS